MLPFRCCVLLITFSCFAVRDSSSQTADILVHRRESGDYLENTWSSLCDQYLHTIWDDQQRLCKCSSPKFSFASFAERPVGCYEGNEDNTCMYLHSSINPSSIHSENVTQASPLVSIDFAEKTFETCGIKLVERWDLRGWTPNNKIGKKLKKDETLAVTFAGTIGDGRTKGSLFRFKFICGEQEKCFLLKIEGTRLLATVVIPQTTVSPTPSLVTVPATNQQKDDDGVSQTTTFVLGAIVAILVVCVAGGAFLFHRFRKRQRSKNPPKSQMRDISMRSQRSDNFYEDIGDGLYSDVTFNSSRDLYLDPIETMKRPSPPLPTNTAPSTPSTTPISENKYSLMQYRPSYIPSKETVKRFNVHQPQPSIPKGNQSRDSYISTHDAEQSTLNKNNISSDTTRENERYSSLDPSEAAGCVNDGYVSLTTSPKTNPPSNLAENQNTEDTYDVVGTISIENAGESTYDCAI